MSIPPSPLVKLVVSSRSLRRTGEGKFTEFAPFTLICIVFIAAPFQNPLHHGRRIPVVEYTCAQPSDDNTE